MRRYNSNQKTILFLIRTTLVVLSSLQAIGNQCFAQIIPDETLGSESSQINSVDELRERVEGGAVRGKNLFHSFEEFGVPKGMEVYFANPDGISNIFSRITGNNISEIFGTLGVEGIANLFLINPNGIVFGENASVDIGGSFIATTAERVHFDDGSILDIRDREKPILTWNAPIGLGLEENSGSITVRGLGHNLALNTTEPTSRLPALSSLNVQPEKTLALIARDIILDGGVLNAPEGHIELGAIISGKVFFNSVNPDNFQYDTTSLGNIQLRNESLADASGLFGGSIHSISNRITFSSGSGFFVQNRLTSKIQNIQVDTNFLKIIGGDIRFGLLFDRGAIETTPDSQFVVEGFIDGEPLEPGMSTSVVLEKFNLSLEDGEFVTRFLPSFIFSEGLQNASGNHISINSRNISVLDGAQLTTRSFGNANAGNININEASIIEVKGASNTPGFSERSFEIFSLINSTNFGSGRGGSLNLKVDTINTSNGGSISSINSGVGEGGNVTIDANKIELIGSVPNVFLPSAISSSTIDKGNAGNLIINSNSISLRDGAGIGSSTFAEGNSGEVQIFVKDLIEIKGIESSSQIPSSISSEASLLPPPLRKAFFLPPFPTGDVGSLTISANKIEINNASQISVQNNGVGNAGELQIESNNIEINNQGQITAAARQGEGGNITIKSDRLSLNSSIISASANEEGGNISVNASDLDVSDSQIEAESLSQQGGNITIEGDRTLFQDSNLSASAAKEGDGGNITIDADTVLGINSDITATAVEGNGGNILINSNGVLGFTERPATNNDGASDVDASSQFGTDGTVTITNPQNTISDPLILLVTAPPRDEKILSTGDCYNEAGEPLLTDNTHDNVPDSPRTYLDNDDISTSKPVEESLQSPSDDVIEKLLWKPGQPYAEAIADTQIQTPDGRIFAVNRKQLMQMQQQGCLQLHEIEE